ncbi:ThdF protein [Borreliella burgdorferi CA-11.2A]|nr:ThdF protein [Borreliella burgdorferi CA-11.2A]
MSKFFERDDDIVALATPFLSSALCVIRSSGASSISKFSKIFQIIQLSIQHLGIRFITVIY